MNPETSALVSVSIPTYRGAAFLASTIESALNQSYPHLEIWILDDNSPDETRDVVARYSDPRLSYLRNERNLGPNGNWNRCLEVAQGKYFKLLPHDDLLAPDCIREQVAVLEADTKKEIALVFGSREIIGPNGRAFATRGLPRAKAGRIDGRELIRRCVRAGTNLVGEPGNSLFRRELIEKVGHYDATHPYLVDLDYWFRILSHGDAYYTATRSSSFRVSAGSWSVAIGGRQYRDFKGFVAKFAADAKLGISSADKRMGFARAKLNTLGRALVYRSLFLAK